MRHVGAENEVFPAFILHVLFKENVHTNSVFQCAAQLLDDLFRRIPGRLALGMFRSQLILCQVILVFKDGENVFRIGQNPSYDGFAEGHL